MNLLRKYKISKIYNDALTGTDKEIIEFILHWLNDLTIFDYNKEEFPNRIIYMKGDKFVLQSDIKMYMVRDADFYNVLTNRYDLNYVDAKDLIKYIISDVFKTKKIDLHIDLRRKNKKLMSIIEEKYKEYNNELSS